MDVSAGSGKLNLVKSKLTGRLLSTALILSRSGRRQNFANEISKALISCLIVYFARFMNDIIAGHKNGARIIWISASKFKQNPVRNGI
jgi:hypothetical protein